MEEKNKIDWAVFIISFVFAAIPTWLVVGGVVWRYSPNTAGSTVLMAATISAVIIGLIAGLKGSGFWSAASTVGSYTPYARKHKNDK